MCKNNNFMFGLDYFLKVIGTYDFSISPQTSKIGLNALRELITNSNQYTDFYIFLRLLGEDPDELNEKITNGEYSEYFADLLGIQDKLLLGIFKNVDFTIIPLQIQRAIDANNIPDTLASLNIGTLCNYANFVVKYPPHIEVAQSLTSLSSPSSFNSSFSSPDSSAYGSPYGSQPSSQYSFYNTPFGSEPSSQNSFNAPGSPPNFGVSSYQGTPSQNVFTQPVGPPNFGLGPYSPQQNSSVNPFGPLDYQWSPSSLSPSSSQNSEDSGAPVTGTPFTFGANMNTTRGGLKIRKKRYTRKIIKKNTKKLHKKNKRINKFRRTKKRKY
jgi:hypothetical protein